jgi:hypothetical protein
MMIEPRHGEWWIGKWSGTDFNCVMQYSAETKDWHDAGIESSPTEHSFNPISKMEQAKPEPQKQFKYEKVTESIFDLKDEFERGELWWKWEDDYYPIGSEVKLMSAIGNECIYRKTEVDAVEELAEEIYSIASDGMDTKALCYLAAKRAIDKLGAK